MVTFITVIHFIVCFLLVVIVLLQHGKGADVGATFGGGSQTVLGARGAATFLSKLTAGIAITFMITSLALAYFSARESQQSVFQEESQVTGLDQSIDEKEPSPDTLSDGATEDAQQNADSSVADPNGSAGQPQGEDSGSSRSAE